MVPNLEVPFLEWRVLVWNQQMDELGEHTWILKIIDFKIRHHHASFCISDSFENSMDVLRSIRGCVDGRDAVWRLIWACVCQRPNLFSQQFGRFLCLKWKISHHAQTDWNHLTWTWTWHIFLKDLHTYTYPLIRPLYKAFYLGEVDKGGILQMDIDSNMICLALVSCKDKDPPSPYQRSFRELDAYVQVRRFNDLLNCSFVLL